MVYLNNPKLYAIKIEDHKKGGLFQLTDFETLNLRIILVYVDQLDFLKTSNQI